ncbi:MAG: hypothetical protein P4L10_14110 [Acidobacteriaceae bacterium]|nr:hypothetical protein [Acidobacteriaceae bacterium]
MQNEEEGTGVSRALVWIEHGLRGALIVLSAAAMIAFVRVALLRLHFAYEYDWIEDGMVASVRHIAAGLPLYGAPSVHFTPYLYTPLYLYLSAALGKVIGVSYVTLRVASIAATLGCFAAIFALVYGETRRMFAACAGAGMFAACYAAVDGSFDIGRVDMLYVLLVLCALYATRHMHPLFAALLWVCAFQTKQGVLPIAALLLCHDWQRPRRVLMGVAGFALMLAGSIAWLNYATHGWYRFYVFGLAGAFGLEPHWANQFIRLDMEQVCGVALLIMVIAAVMEVVRRRQVMWRAGFSFYALGSVGMIAYTGFIRAHRGANTNSLIPAYAWTAVLFGVALAWLYRRLEERGTAWAQAATVALLLAAGWQIVRLRYHFDDFVPPQNQQALRDNMEARLRSIPGDVLVLGHPEDGLMAGKTGYAGSESIGAVIDAKDRGPGDELIAEYAVLIHSGKLAAVALDSPAEGRPANVRTWMPRDFLTHYPLRVEDAGGDAREFTSEPKYIYLPCPMAGAPDVARQLDAKVNETACRARH